MFGYESAALGALDMYGEADISHLIGTGESRNCYLIDGIVYKVSNCGYIDDNMREYAMLSNLAKRAVLPDYIAIPRVGMHDNVIAMEYIEGNLCGFCIDCESDRPCQYGDCMPKFVYDYLRSVGIYDLTGFNVIEANGVYYPIDAAC